MQTEKKGRITNTSLSDMTASFYDESGRRGYFNTIAHMPLGYGFPGNKETELDYYESIAFFTKAATEERSTIFILGFAPRQITSTWIKAAELIIKGSGVKMVLIPHAVLLDDDHNNPFVFGGLLYVQEEGITKIESFGTLKAEDFWTKIAEIAKSMNRPK